MPSPCKQWLTGTNFFVYLSHFLSAWGDRMWSFGVGLFLINISPESLQLTAAYGLSMGLSVLLFGALVGDIVDKAPRLKAAQTALVLQNVFVAACAVLVYLFLVFRIDIVSFGSWTIYTTYAIIITLSVLSRLTSMARQIAVEKDWIVEMCGKDYDKLATMTASLRRIDLATQVLAPIATGLIMTFAGVHFGALFIGGWNLGSVVIEYYFLWKVYNTVPALKKKKNLSKSQVVAENMKVNEESPALDIQDNPVEAGGRVVDTDEYQSSAIEDDTKSRLNTDIQGISKNVSNPTRQSDNPEKTQDMLVVDHKRQGCKCSRMFNSLERLYQGWPVYARYDVLHAGIALACLYMTVLGFDSVTIGYAKMQGVPEGLVGITMGIAALFGIFGTFMYPVMRRRLGLTRTGIFGLSLQITCLTFCVNSVWMPGSHFDLTHGYIHSSALSANPNCTEDFNETKTYNFSYSDGPLGNITYPCFQLVTEPKSHLSIGLLLAGIASARFGLWIADLSITQLFMERVAETERGKVNGVQSSINQLMDMLKFLMVILAPYDHQFGLLVLISFSFICIGWLFYAVFLYKDRGHFFHFDKCLNGCGKAQLL